MFRRYQRPTPGLLPAGATVVGWDIFLPLDQRALFTAHAKVGLVVDEGWKHLKECVECKRGYNTSRPLDQ